MLLARLGRKSAGWVDPDFLGFQLYDHGRRNLGDEPFAVGRYPVRKPDSAASITA
jgi:hypothetical protein